MRSVPCVRGQVQRNVTLHDNNTDDVLFLTQLLFSECNYVPEDWVGAVMAVPLQPGEGNVLITCTGSKTINIGSKYTTCVSGRPYPVLNKPRCITIGE